MNIINNIIDRRYNIIRRLGCGAMGDVYLAEDLLQENSRIALKIIRGKGLNYEKAGLFKKEFSILNMINHPNIMKVKDFGYDNARNMFYFTNEFIEGHTLRELLEKGKEFSLGDILDIAVSLGRAVDFIHSRGIVHRDIKPGNIMVDPDNNVKLMDFGLADLIKKDDARFKGTLYYAAPENFTEGTDCKSDIYQLGIVLLELATCQNIFGNIASDRIIEIMGNNDLFTINRARAFESIRDKRLEHILNKMTAFDKNDRYMNCAEIILDINRLFERNYKLESNATMESYFTNPVFIGREDELSMLKTNIQDEKGSRIFILKGSAGLGKDMLINEIKKFCQMDELQFFEGRCLDSAISSKIALQELLGYLMLYAPDDILDEAGSDIAMILPKEERLSKFSPPDYSSQSMAKEIMIDSITDLFILYAEQSEKQSVIALRDFHYADSDLKEIFKNLCYKLQKMESGNLRLIISINPDHADQNDFLDFLGSNKLHFVNILLKPFTAVEAGLYTESIFGTEKTDDSIHNIYSYLRDISSGIPDFLKEIIREFVNSGQIHKSQDKWILSPEFSKELSIKDKDFKGLIQERLERTDFTAEQKELLKFISLFSKAPNVRELSFLMGKKPQEIVHMLEELSDKSLILARKAQNEINYAFINQLLQRSIQDQINPGEKAEKNLKIAEALEYLYRGSIEMLLDIVSYHYSRSGMKDKAEEYLLLYADQCDKLHKAEDSVRLYKQVLGITGEDQIEKIAQVSLKLAANQMVLDQNDDAVDSARKALSLAREIMDKRLLNKSRLVLAQALAKAGNKADAILILDEILNYYSGNEEDDLLIEAYNEYGNIYWKMGEYDTARSFFLKQIDIASRKNNRKSIAKAHNNIGLIMFHEGNTADAKEHFQKCLDYSLEENDLILTGIAMGNMGLIFWKQKDYERALELFESKLEISRKLGLKREISVSLVNIADIMSDKGDYSKAVDIYEEQIGLTRLINDRYLNTITGINLGTVYKEMGDIKSAFAALQESRINAEEIEHKELQSVSLINLGDIYKLLDNLEMAQKCYNEAISIAEEIELNMYLPYYYLTRADLAFQSGDYEDCLRYTLKGLDVSEKINDRSLMTDLKIISLKSEYYLSGDEAEKSEILSKMKNYANNCNEDRELALVSYEIFRITGKFFWGYSALKYYRRLFKRIEKYEYKNRIENLENILRLKYHDLSSDDYISGIFLDESLDKLNQSEIVNNFRELDRYRKLDYFASEIIYLCSRPDCSRDFAGKISNSASYIKNLIKNLEKESFRERKKDKPGTGETEEIEKEISSIITGNTDRDIRNVEMLLEAVRASSSTLDVDVLLVRIMDMILKITEAERGFILLKSKEDGTLKISVKRAKNLSDDEIEEDFSRSIPQKVLQTGVPVCLKDSAVESATTSMLDLDLRSVMCVPLQIRNYRFGVIYVDSHTALKQFTDTDLSFFNALTSQIAGAIENARLYNEAIELTNRIQSYNQELLESEKSLKISKLEVEKLKNLLDNIINSIPAMILAIDTENSVIMWNKTASCLTGISHGNITGKNIFQGLPYFERYKGKIETVKSSNKVLHLFKEKIDFTPECETFYDVLISPLIGGESTLGTVFRIEDTTEREKKNQQLIQAQKLEIVGTLASGLAHDFNNVLGVLIGSISLIKIKIKSLEINTRNQISEYLDSMNTAIQRARNLVVQLISLTRRDRVDFLRVDLNSCINTVAILCNASLDKRIDFHFSLFPGPAYVFGNSSQIEQALLNLCINAMHAMTIMNTGQNRLGNRLELKADEFTADENFCEVYPDATRGKYWLMSIIDQGVGMDSATLSKIFDPFFSTKNKDIGTGLGLFMVYDIIRKHSGIITVESTPGAGSRFDIYLPQAKDAC